MILYHDLLQKDAESLRQLLLDAILDTDLLKIDLSHVGSLAPGCRDILLSFSNGEKENSTRLLIFRRRRADTLTTDIELGKRVE